MLNSNEDARTAADVAMRGSIAKLMGQDRPPVEVLRTRKWRESPQGKAYLRKQ